MPRVLIVDDEPAISMAVHDELVFEGFSVEVAADGPTGLEQARVFEPDVVLLDVMLPGINGFEVCRRLRSDMPDVWIIMLTVREHEVDRVRGLELGADDYVTKPFSLRELVARVRVGLRRRRPPPEQQVMAFGPVEVHPRARRVLLRGEEIELTPKEYQLLELMAQRPGEVITRDEFLDALWGDDVYVTARVVDTHMAALRKKLEDDPTQPLYFHSVRGAGYRFDPAPVPS